MQWLCFIFAAVMFYGIYRYAQDIEPRSYRKSKPEDE